ncbi:MAG: TerC/Alx family metal homeostasis membrane protein [Nocardioides sp.]
MDVAPWVWWTTLAVTAVALAVDVFVIGRRPHEPSMRESARHLVGYVGAAVVFGIGVWILAGSRYGGEFFAGWLTEYSLSVDNLFIFIIIMGKFAVPRQFQQTVLLVGIVIALVMRGLFIAVGAAAITHFSWVFYLFGAFLVLTAVNLVREGNEEDQQYDEPRLVRWLRKHVPLAEGWDGVRLTTRSGSADARRAFTPMFLVVITIGITDLLFALDSIPAIYGLTSEPYLVLTANVFALWGCASSTS